MIPTLSFARSLDEIKSTVIEEFNNFARNQGYFTEAMFIKLAYSKATTSYKGTIFVLDGIDDKVMPIAVDVWDGEDLVWRLKGSILNLKR